MEVLIRTMVFVLGLCFGSFVNMLVYRTAEKYGLISKSKCPMSKRVRSFCDYCGRQLKWYENIPVVSWLFLRGKTWCCKKKLPLSYPLVELIMGFLLVLLEIKYGVFGSVLYSLSLLNILKLFFGLILTVLLVFSAVFDLKYMILPDFSIFILIGIAFLGVLFDEPNIILYLLSAIGASGFLWFLNLITKGKGMGLGDVKLAVFMGLFLGYPKIILAFYVAFIVGAIYGIVLVVFKKAKRKSQIPFGPFLILGTFVTWWWGNLIINLVI